MATSPGDQDVEKMIMPALQEEWVVVNGLPTYVLKLGEIRADLPLVLILPGMCNFTDSVAWQYIVTSCILLPGKIVQCYLFCC